MRTSSYRSAILLAAAAVLSLASAVYAFVDASPPAAPDLEAEVVHGATAYDRAVLRASEPPYAVADLTRGTVGPIVSLDELPDHPNAEAVGPWFIAKPAGEARFGPRIEDAAVRLDGPKSRRCQRRGSRHVCGKAGWQVVAPKEVRISGRTQECIWAHPIAGHELVIEYPGVVGGPWRVSFGLVDAAVGTGVPVDIQIRYADEDFTHLHPDRRGFSTLQLPASDELTPLELRISAKDVGRRHFCYRIEGP